MQEGELTSPQPDAPRTKTSATTHTQDRTAGIVVLVEEEVVRWLVWTG
jgi:hypothetical protein